MSQADVSTSSRLEDTITFHLIERVQFPLNLAIYDPAALPIPNTPLSLFSYMLREQERVHSRMRRYQSPDEYPFFPDALEPAVLPPLQYPRILHPNNVNVNAKIQDIYVRDIIPAICTGARAEAQETFGSSATVDVLLIQALSRRIHFGKFVAESKFRAERELFTGLIEKRDAAAIGDLITKPAVEKKVLERLRLKAKTYGTEPGTAVAQGKIDVDAVVAMYKDVVIPLTKEVEVDYLLQRLN